MDDIRRHRHSEVQPVAGNIAQPRILQNHNRRALLQQVRVLLRVHFDEHIPGVEIAGERGDDLRADGTVPIFVAQRLFGITGDRADKRKERVDGGQHTHNQQANDGRGKHSQKDQIDSQRQHRGQTRIEGRAAEFCAAVQHRSDEDTPGNCNHNRRADRCGPGRSASQGRIAPQHRAPGGDRGQGFGLHKGLVEAQIDIQHDEGCPRRDPRGHLAVGPDVLGQQPKTDRGHSNQCRRLGLAGFHAVVINARPGLLNFSGVGQLFDGFVGVHIQLCHHRQAARSNRLQQVVHIQKHMLDDCIGDFARAALHPVGCVQIQGDLAVAGRRADLCNHFAAGARGHTHPLPEADVVKLHSHDPAIDAGFRVGGFGQHIPITGDQFAQIGGLFALLPGGRGVGLGAGRGAEGGPFEGVDGCRLQAGKIDRQPAARGGDRRPARAHVVQTDGPVGGFLGVEKGGGDRASALVFGIKDFQ